jgi:hypothetical protein
MNEPFETDVPRIKFLQADSDETRNKATGYSCKMLLATVGAFLHQTDNMERTDIFYYRQSNQ